MSDDVYAIRTTYQDVAELGQGYLERADGERMLLPLPVEVSDGEGVRFIVYLTDGTPAFAGAGRAVQVSDQGGDVPSEARYETLIDALVFDERSRPVYDYIVAVRQMAYADAGAAAEAQAVGGEEAVLEGEEEPTVFNDTIAASFGRITQPAPEAVTTVAFDEANGEVEADVAYSEPPIEPDADAFSEVTSAVQPDHARALDPDLEPVTKMAEPHGFEPGTDRPTPVPDEDPVLESARPQVFTIGEDDDEATGLPRTLSTAPLPRGMLRRPAIAAHWVPKSPRRPQPTQGSGLFRYAAGSLPVPAHPPRPDLEPGQRVQPAAAPTTR